MIGWQMCRPLSSYRPRPWPLHCPYGHLKSADRCYCQTHMTRYLLQTTLASGLSPISGNFGKVPNPSPNSTLTRLGEL